MDQYSLTKEGYKKLEAEHEKLTQEERPAMLEKLREAREMGNLEDNLQYEAVKSELELVDARIREVEDLLNNAEVVSAGSGDEIKVGNIVVVEIDSGQEEYQIVSPYESNPSTGKISYESPVGKALVGRGEGEEVVVKLPQATISYRVLKIKS